MPYKWPSYTHTRTHARARTSRSVLILNISKQFSLNHYVLRMYLDIMCSFINWHPLVIYLFIWIVNLIQFNKVNYYYINTHS